MCEEGTSGPRARRACIHTHTREKSRTERCAGSCSLTCAAPSSHKELVRGIPPGRFKGWVLSPCQRLVARCRRAAADKRPFRRHRKRRLRTASLHYPFKHRLDIRHYKFAPNSVTYKLSRQNERDALAGGPPGGSESERTADAAHLAAQWAPREPGGPVGGLLDVGGAADREQPGSRVCCAQEQRAHAGQCTKSLHARAQLHASHHARLCLPRTLS